MKKVILAIFFILSFCVADQRHFVWTYEYKTIERGEVEFEHQYTTSYFEASNLSNNTKIVHQLELEIGMNERYDVAIYHQFEQQDTFKYKGYNPTYGWRKKKKEIVELDAQGFIHYGDNKPYKKIYIEDSKGVPVQNFWNDIHPITRREGRVYPTQKPINLLKRIIKSSCSSDGIVFDPFSGSGTTLFAAKELGRKCIISDFSKEACDLVSSKFNNLLDKANTSGKDIW